MKMIATLQDKEKIKEQFLLGSVAKGLNKTNMPYYSIELKDSSGTINAKKWEVLPQDDEVLVSGNVVEVEGEVTKFNETLQIRIISIKPVALEDIDKTRFVKNPPIPKEELTKKFNNYIASIQDDDLKKIIVYIVNKFGDKVYEYPAATSIHHDYASGLLMHTTTMADIATKIIDFYQPIDRDLLISGILLHDLGKTIEFEGPITYKYSLEGKLLGHISIMVSEIREAAHTLNINSEKVLLLEHLIISHHGQQEFGSPIIPLTKEALLLSLIDNLDSKMVIVGKALENIEPGSFSQKVFALDGRLFYKNKE